VGDIRLHMRSLSGSDPEVFPVRVLSQTFVVSDVFTTTFVVLYNTGGLSCIIIVRHTFQRS
jgi:hypothetical protein